MAVLCLFFASDYNKLLEPDSYYKGQQLSLGSYPQSLVSDKETLAALGELELDWKYFDDCYAGEDYYGTMKRTDCMKYADVACNASRYRAVVIEQFRPNSVLSPATAEESRQDENGFEQNKVYWFHYEPIRWTIVNPSQGLMLSRAVLDAMPFNDSFYWVDRDFDKNVFIDKELSSTKQLFTPANLYKTSSVRKWLNSGFYELAFSGEEQQDIKGTWHLTHESSESVKYGLCSLNHDKVFLPSWKDISRFQKEELNTLVRFVPVTDYARCRGTYSVLRDGKYYTWYWLSTPGDGCADVFSAYSNKDIINFDRQFFYAYSVGGIRCAACLKQSALDRLSAGGEAQ
ncbi:MAG: hypothetical protein IKE65_01780 [Clostridia bacterium]|nr:hypothetical protein [Clostridia bacterium]